MRYLKPILATVVASFVFTGCDSAGDSQDLREDEKKINESNTSVEWYHTDEDKIRLRVSSGEENFGLMGGDDDGTVECLVIADDVEGTEGTDSGDSYSGSSDGSMTPGFGLGGPGKGIAELCQWIGKKIKKPSIKPPRRPNPPIPNRPKLDPPDITPPKKLPPKPDDYDLDDNCWALAVAKAIACSKSNGKSCKAKGGVQPSAEVCAMNGVLNSGCCLARANYQSTCYKPGDPGYDGHQEQTQNACKAAASCALCSGGLFDFDPWKTTTDALQLTSAPCTCQDSAFDIFRAEQGTSAAKQVCGDKVLITKSSSCQCDAGKTETMCVDSSDVPADLKEIFEGKKGHSFLMNGGMPNGGGGDDDNHVGDPQFKEVHEVLPIDTPFTEHDHCPANPCDSVALICGGNGLGVGLNIGLGIAGDGSLMGCLAELGLNVPFDIAEIRSIDSYADFSAFFGEKMCDAIGCFPPTGPWGPAIGACACYSVAKGALDCRMAELECEMAENERPIEDPIIGHCAHSSVMSCVRTPLGVRPTTDAEIALQCRNMARDRYYRDGTPDFNECVANCQALTERTRDGADCGGDHDPVDDIDWENIDPHTF